MQEKGVPAQEVLNELKTKLEKDLSFSSGKIIGSMCTSPHPIAKKAFCLYMDKNLGDPGLFPATAEMEKEVIKSLGTLLSNPSAVGHIVTGGTEANILALWAARNLHRQEKREVIIPVSAHYSFEKAADLLGLKLVKVRLNKNFQIDLEEVRRVINSKTLAIVGVAGTTSLGVVDPIPELSEIAEENGIHLHVDAAFGGFVLPFLKELGYNAPEFDFKLPGVSSITIDPHKMGLAPIPAGGILFRNDELRNAITMGVSYLAGGEMEQAVLTGTRPGASIIAVWAVMRHLGWEGYKKVVSRCMFLTTKLVDAISEVDGIEVVIPPVMNVVGLKSEVFSIRHIAKELRSRGWAISLFPSHIRIVVMPHIKEEHVESFIKDLKDIVRKRMVRSKPC